MQSDQRARNEAKEFARRVIEDSFKQSIDDEELNAVAEKILLAVPSTVD